MGNPGKERYDLIPIPDDKLLLAIDRGFAKNHRMRRMRRLRRFAVSAASVFLAVSVCVNVPSISAYAEEIPILRFFVQAFRAGEGGEDLENVAVLVEGGPREAVISFAGENGQTDRALSYSVSSHLAPARLEVIFDGAGQVDFEMIRQEILKATAVRDVYETIARRAADFSFVIALNKGYNYEVMEFADPGELTVSFYPDAYYEKGEPHPDQEIYFLRSQAVAFGDELRELLEQYWKESPVQVKAESGDYLIAVGGYDTREDAEEAAVALEERYGDDFSLYVDSGRMGEAPAE